MNIEVYTDGSATTNDKPGGWAWVLVVDGSKHAEGNGHMPNASNNDAELEGAIQGLRAAFTFACTRSESDVNVTLVSDSQLILGWANGKYTFRQANKIDKFKELQLAVTMANAKTRWVEGHSGNEFNERCDTLANEARLQKARQEEKIDVLTNGGTLIGTKRNGVICVWYKNTLKVINLDDNIVENYDRSVHGSRGSMLEIREEKSR